MAAAVTIHWIDVAIGGVALKTGGIAGVATRWDYRRRGLATRLLREAIKRIRSRGLGTTMLFTGVQLPAKRIYGQLGYVDISRWLRYSAIYRPADILKRMFESRAKWLLRTPCGRPALKSWRERVLIEGDDWRATVTFNGKKFAVQPGKRGNPTLMMRGGTYPIFECFGNSVVYDRHLKEGRVSVAGLPHARGTWRRIVSQEWRE